MSRQDIVALFERRNAAWAAKDAHALAQLHAEHGSVASPTGGVLEGRKEIERIYQVWLSAFPDIQVKVEDVIIDGNRAVELAHLTGTHAGEFFGVSPTGRRVAVATASVVTIENGEIAHERRILDFTGVLVQVGVLKAKPA
jgi:steroid delta-isomerase-like uncharacterized protein